MIFVNTKDRADDLHAFLVEKGLKVAKIHGDSSTGAQANHEPVKNLDFEYIVATDLAAVGLILKGSVMSSTMLFHKTYPSLFTVLAGLVGMVSGTAITLYQPSDDSDIRELENWASSLSLRS